MITYRGYYLTPQADASARVSYLGYDEFNAFDMPRARRAVDALIELESREMLDDVPVLYPVEKVAVTAW